MPRSVLSASENRTAGHVQNHAADPAGAFRSQKESCLGDVFRRAEALDWVRLDHRSLRGVRNVSLIGFGENCFGRDTIDADRVAPHLGGDVLSHELDAGLGGGIWQR